MPGAAGSHVRPVLGGTAMNYQERALNFSCRGERLYGVASVPQQPAGRGVLVVVGGPQYRVGSHRQFTLLARSLAEQGIAAMRFDYRGMGDSEGAARNFEAVEDDLRAAVDHFLLAVPAITEVVIWGLCDAATAAMFYAAHDARVTGLVLLNPWARTSEGIAKTTLKHYYRSRLLDAGLWKKIATGRFAYAAAGASFVRLVRAAFGAGGRATPADGEGACPPTAALPERMLSGLAGFKGKVLLIISPGDLTAQEFLDMTKASPDWQRLLADPRVQRHALADADHTFSRRVWRDQVSSWTGQWVKSW
jgi:exosortase A-associated hydrolase 1